MSDNNQNIDVLILCGGQGTRFRKVRDDIPKSLAPIHGRPFLDHLLDDLVFQGFRRVILATGYLSKQIETHVKHRREVECIISRELHPLGTGGAIKFAEPHFSSNSLLVLNGDSRIQFSFQKLLTLHQQKNADLTLLLSAATKGTEYGNVEIGPDQQVLAFHEKPRAVVSSLVNAGVYCLNVRLLAQTNCKQFYSLETDWIPLWIQTCSTFGLVINEPIYDIGTLTNYYNYPQTK